MIVNWFKIWRLGLWVALGSLVLWVIGNYLVPGGQVVYSWQPGKSGAFVSGLSPEQRVSLNAQGEWELVGGPAYFSVRTTRPYRSLDLTIKYRQAASQLAEVGLLTDGLLKRYSLQPLYNRVIDTLWQDPAWSKTEDQGLVLLQRHRLYNTVSDFLAHPPKSNEVAAYNYRWPEPTKIKDYQSGQGYDWRYPLVGTVEMLTYIKKETLQVQLAVVDFHKNNVVDEAVLELRNEQGELIATEKLAGTLPVEPNKPELKQLTMIKKDLPEGLYRLNWRASDEIQINRLLTTQSKLTFVSRLKFGSFNQAIKVQVAGPNLKASTAEPSDLQVIKVASSSLAIDQSYHNFSWELPCLKTACELVTAKGGLILATNGYFAPEPRALIRPAVAKIDSFFRLTPQINYIIARYQPPKTENGWQVATIHFDVNGVYNNEGRFGFLLDAPEMPTGANLTIGSIEARLSGSNWREAFKELWTK